MYPLTLGLAIASAELSDEVRAGMLDLPVRVVVEHTEIAEIAPFLERLDRIRPDVVLLEIRQLGDALDEVLRQVKSAAPDSMIVALHTTASPETILAAVRAGAHEYLYPPFGPLLRQALERKSAELSLTRGGTRKGGKTLAFLSAKGGCGATTVACHIAVELGRHDQKVLLADLDLETGLVAFLMKTRTPYTVLDALNNLHRLDLSYWKGLVSNGIPGLEILPASSSLACRQPEKVEQFRHVLGFVRTHYDWTVLDLGRGLSYVAFHVLEEIDMTCLVTTLDVPSLHQAKQIVQTLVERGYAKGRLRLVLNRVTRQMDITSAELEKMLGLEVQAMLPNDYDGLYEAYAEGQLLAPEHPVRKRLGQMARKLAGIPEEKPKGGFSLFR
ncbi:MAG TPA: AAA family ATPase [Bryobacteraceae bacterium]|nr:AAA family ATPase [Bryobacteraceae bacterium]